MNKFEVIANGTSFGIYQGKTREAALLASVIDAGYRSIADAAERTGQIESGFKATFKIEDAVEITNVRLELWGDGQTPAILFTVTVDGEEISTLEWLDSDGDLETRDSHIDAAHNFSWRVNAAVREQLEEYLRTHHSQVTALLREIAENDEDEDEAV